MELMKSIKKANIMWIGGGIIIFAIAYMFFKNIAVGIIITLLIEAYIYKILKNMKINALILLEYFKEKVSKEKILFARYATSNGMNMGILVVQENGIFFLANNKEKFIDIVEMPWEDIMYYSTKRSALILKFKNEITISFIVDSVKELDKIIEKYIDKK